MKKVFAKRAILCLLCMAVLCASLPLTASAAQTDAWDGTTIDVSWYNTTDKVFYISTPEQLMGLAAIVNGIYNSSITTVIGNASYIVDNYADTGADSGSNNKSSDAYHYGGDDFNGKTVYLTADLDMGGVCDPVTGAWSGPNYMPIGGQYLMEKDNSSTKLSSSFCGVLDGQGHYVLNIYCDRYCSTGNYGDGQSVGLIGRLGVHDSDAVSLRPSGAAVRNLAVTGYIYANRSVGGIVGKIGKTVDGGTIENCANYATVSNTDAKGCGGIVGAGWNGGEVLNCFNAGSISTTYPCPTGGISGSNEIVLENCYNVGTIYAPYSSYAMAIGTNNGGGNQVDNCYWLSGSATGGGYYGSNKGTVTELTSSAMTAASFVSKLGSAFLADTAGINNGYPILKWQAQSSVDPLAEPPAPAGYADVATDAWYYTAVQYVMNAGLFDLTGTDTFSPTAPMTRLMLAEALYRLAGSPAVNTSQSPFTDCSAASVIWAYENGVVNGVGDGQYDPGGSITREQIAAMFMRYVALTESTDERGDMTGFPDASSVSSWARDAASWAVGVGIIHGTGAGNLEPQGTASRAEVAQILLNFT